MKLKRIAGKTALFLANIAAFVELNIIKVFANDPWAALDGRDTEHKYIQGMGALYKLFYAVGIMGCILTSMWYIIKILIDPADAREKANAKSGISWKMIVAFLIFTAISVMGLVAKIIMKFSGNE